MPRWGSRPNGHSAGTTRAEFAVCITGLERTLLSWPVLSSFRRHLLAPHAAAGHRVDTFIALVGGRNATQQRVRGAYRPVSLSVHPAQRLEELETHRCSPTNRSYMDRAQSLTQWIAIRRCYHQVQRYEEHRGARYTWIYRTRTDVVLLADTPFAAVSVSGATATGRVYTPINGMSGSRMYACANDMIFVCPRALCRPYFELLELWTSPHCTPASWPQVAPSERWGVAAAVGINAKGRAVLPARTIFADERTGAPNGMSGPPTEPYWLPPKPKKMDVHYYFYARYSDGRICTSRPPGSSVVPRRCCGLMAEALWPYTIARQCTFDHDLHQRPAVSCPRWAYKQGGVRKLECLRLMYVPPEYKAWVQPYFLRCRQMQREWEAATNETAPWAPPDHGTPKLRHRPRFLCEDIAKPNRNRYEWWHEDVHTICAATPNTLSAPCSKVAGSEGAGCWR